MVSIDYSLGVQIVNFLLLIFILDRLLYRPILDMIDRRKRRLEESESEIKRLRESVEQKMAAYEEKLRQAKAAAVEQKNEIIGQGALDAKAILDAVRGEIPGIIDRFHSQMDGEMETARKILTKQSQTLSVEIAEKVLGRSLR